MSQDHYQDNNSSPDYIDDILKMSSQDLQLLYEAQFPTTMDNEGTMLSANGDPVYFAQPGIQDYGIGNYQPNDVPLSALDDGQYQNGFNGYSQPMLEQSSPQHYAGTPPPRYLSIEPVSATNTPTHLVDVHSPFDPCYSYMTPSPSAPSPATAIALVQPKFFGLSFRNLAEAKDSMLNRYIENDWVPPANDSTIPTTDEDRAGHVAELLAAMKDTSACPDNQDKDRFAKRLTPGAKKAIYEDQMEKVCWQLVDTAEKLHFFGPKSFSIYDTTPLQTMYKSRNLTFGERIDSLCELLRLSKGRCFSLLKGENLETTVGAAPDKITGTILNNEQNGNRQKYIAEGRTRVKEKKATTSPEDQASVTDGDKELESGVAMSLPSNDLEEELHLNVATSLQSSGPLPPADIGASIIGDVQSNNTQTVSQYAGDNGGQYENNQHVTGNSYRHGPQPVFHHALPSPGMLSPSMRSSNMVSPNMLSPSASYAPTPTPSLHGIYSPSTQPSPVMPWTPSPSYMPHMTQAYSHTPYQHLVAIPRPNRVMKRSAEDAQLGMDPYAPVQRPRFDDQQTYWQ
ncbi:uncharacterized protein J4E79_005965 [Alternaria viburni]|uniref:uncharacterized protein n=1 Tax=Alternaria viburni TaxID=566460 RepID=UPI0020C3DA4C|nr:uncharacterized protein J4E79_005965 [Alternaria viburni]KAI4660160.1 hypothetical protein J4E79_005965 [Alternaria viburni]